MSALLEELRLYFELLCDYFEIHSNVVNKESESKRECPGYVGKDFVCFEGSFIAAGFHVCSIPDAEVRW